MKTLREKLQEIEGGEPLTDSDIIEMVVYGETAKPEYDHDEHRWYTTWNKVVKVGGIFIDFAYYSNSGDEDALCGEGDKMVIDSMVEVFPKEITVTDYVTADKL